MKAGGAETCWHLFNEPVALKRNKGLIKEIKAFKLSLSASHFFKNHPKLSFLWEEANLFKPDKCSVVLLNTQTLQHPTSKL